MIQLALAVLVFGALIALIFGKEAGQKFVGFCAAVALVGFVALFLAVKRLDDVGGRNPYPGESLTTVPFATYAAASGGKVFGFDAQVASPTTCSAYGITHTGNSLVVTKVHPGYGAQSAGLLPGDVIVQVDGAAPDSQELTAVKSRHNIGETIAFKIVRPDRTWWNYYVRLG